MDAEFFSSLQLPQECHQFTISEIHLATQNFDESLVIGHGGTFGYLDPHYVTTGRITRKSDVYAFGVVLLEVLSGKQAVDSRLNEENWGLVNWAQESMKEGRLKHIVDYNLRRRILPKCLKEFASLADRCLHSNPKQRPTMAEVVACLEYVLALQEKATSMTSRRKRLKSLELYFDTVGDFALARCLAVNEADRIDAIHGTSGYIAPEIDQANRVSTKADVYSFGVLILETITGCSMYKCEHVLDISKNWCEGTCWNIKDPRIDANSSSITRLFNIGLLCIEEYVDRSTMEEVVSMLTDSSSLTLPIPYGTLVKEKLPDFLELNWPVMNEMFPDFRKLPSLQQWQILSQWKIPSDDYDSGAVEDFIFELQPR
ncbi:hypothetical protein L2E82_01694 [Cichorium intybus]|uniref:Uncharacterized protein n=1 Tax=Cichorium intybus TaxID=13427 RepID=A0ACB9H0P7_CICIN|nr:hypothetical protein L2E82_01694 [Cichorium intybus]